MSEPQVKILHVDDNETNRYVVSRILRRSGFTVIEAATGESGLNAAIEQQPDLVILDVKLPDLSGFEVCRQIKTNPETSFIPVLHLSASFVKGKDKAEGLDSGADAYLTEPVEQVELLATVRSLLRIRRAEEASLALAREWQTTFDSINDGVCLLDQSGKFLRCNRRMTQLLHKPLSDILGLAHQEVMKASIGVGDGSCFSSARANHQREVLEMQAQQQWFAKTIDPIVDDQGAFTGAVFILSDITERKQAEALLQEQNNQLSLLMASLQQQTEQAQQANRIKDEFLAVLSHELRSPLNPILGWAKVLQSRKQDEVRTQYALETIERNAKLQAQLIEDLLDVSRILRGKLSLNISLVNLKSTIRLALETVRLAAEAKSIQIHTFIEPEVQQVLGDSSRLQQVVWNLLSNSIKFTPPGGQVQIRLEQVIGNGSWVTGDQSEPSPLNHYAQITISDTGKGISPEFLPYVFEYFRQADSTTTRRFGGLGLGLAIVRHLIELHGGMVHAESLGEDQGSTFIVKLPVMIAAEGLKPEDAVPGDRPSFNLDGLQVLVVDDDKDTREFITFLLEQYGATVTAAASANAALDALRQIQPDVLLSDIGMPDTDGYMLISQIRERSSEQGGHIPAIALTAYAGETDQKRALAAGFQHHISKPIEPDVLMQTILGMLEKNTRSAL